MVNIDATSRSAALPFDPIQRASDHWRREGWDEAADGMAAVTSIMRAHQLMLARVDAVLRPMGLSFARYEVLMVLRFSRRPALPMSVLGGRLQVHPTSVTSAVDRLEKQRYVLRAQDPSDGRGRLVSITDAGRQVAQLASEALNDEVFANPGLSAPDIKTLVDVLATLRSAAADF